MRFIRQASEGLNHWWRYVLVFVAIVIGYSIGQLPLGAALHRVSTETGRDFNELLNAFAANPNFTEYGISNNNGLLLLLMSFIFAMPVFFYAFISLHKRSFVSLINPLKKVNWKKIIFGFILWVLLAAIAEGIMYGIDPSNYTWQFNLRSFLFLLFIALFLIPIQTSFEELVFRGYLMQLGGLVFKLPIVPILITAILFGAIHLGNPEIGKYGLVPMELYFISAGLFLGIITILDDGMELALGVHAGTNIFGAVGVSYSGGALQTDSLLRMQSIDPINAVIVFLVCAILFSIICAKRYSWPSVASLFRNHDITHNNA